MNRFRAPFFPVLAIALLGLLPIGKVALAQNCGGVAVGTLPGDQLKIKAELFTTRRFEGNKEFLIVRNEDGQFLGAVRVWNVPQTITYTAQKESESIFGFIQGADGDETCEVKPELKKSRLSDKAGDVLNKIGLDWNTVSAAAWAASAILPAGRAATMLNRLAGLSALGGVISVKISAADPSDPDFMVIAVPIIPSLEPLTAQTDVPQELADAFNALVSNEEQIIGVAQALQTSLNRAQGAADAGNAFWENRQMQAVEQYRRQLGTLLNAELPLRASFQDAWVGCAHLPAIDITNVDIFNFETLVMDSGLPADFLDVLTQLGADAATIEQITSITRVQDFNLASGAFPALLTGGDLRTDLTEALRALSGKACQPPPEGRVGVRLTPPPRAVSAARRTAKRA